MDSVYYLKNKRKPSLTFSDLMQRKQQQKELPPGQSIMASILQSIPREANVTKIDYEGPRIALYTTSPRYLMQHNEIISNLVNVIKKRIVVRTDESIRKLEEDARKILKQVGEKIFRPRLTQKSEVSLLTLGGFGQVGRSCMLLTTPDSKILIDCGINPGARSPMDSFPRLDWANITLDDLDAVVIGHAHLDHTGFLPVLCKYGYKGPIYCTEPTLPMMNLIQLDAIKVASAQGRTPMYADRDVKQIMKQAITIPYGTVTDISPDIKLVLANAGHILGSALCHFHIGNGDHNFVYSGDLKFAKSILFESASWNFPRVETLLIESTYGAKEDIQASRQEVESSFLKSVNSILKDGGKVLIPIPAVGRAQEIMMVIDQYMKGAIT